MSDEFNIANAESNPREQMLTPKRNEKKVANKWMKELKSYDFAHFKKRKMFAEAACKWKSAQELCVFWKDTMYLWIPGENNDPVPLFTWYGHNFVRKYH